jgi:hypothetical protein
MGTGGDEGSRGAIGPGRLLDRSTAPNGRHGLRSFDRLERALVVLIIALLAATVTIALGRLS